MPPPRSSPFRTVTDWHGDPWASKAERKAWDTARKRKWIASISEADWLKLEEAVAKGIPAAELIVMVDGLDACVRVGVVQPDDARRFSGVRFGTLEGFALLAFEK